MPRYRKPRLLLAFLAVTFLAATPTSQSADPKADKAAIDKTNEAVRAAFARGDIPAILAYHHPDVTATEQILFSVKGTPKRGGAPFLCKGRTMLVLVRYDKSPAGWATLREIVQPAQAPLPHKSKSYGAPLILRKSMVIGS